MGNNHSSAAKPGSSGSPHDAAAQPNDSSTSSSTPADSHNHHHHHLLPHRKEARNNTAAHSSAAPPEPSLALATGSTIVNRPKSLPGTAVSSLSGSPHSNISTPSKPSEARPVRDEPSKPVDVPIESSSLRTHKDAQMSAAQHAGFDPFLISASSMTDMYLRGPPRLPLPIEEEVHTPGSPILAPEEGLPEVELGESSDGLTRKSSAVSANTLDDDESEELRVDKSRPTVPTKIEWKRGGDKIYVTGTIFQWNRKQRLHPM